MNENDADFFNEIYREISVAVGVDAAVAIYRMYKGQQVTFPVHLYNSKLLYKSLAEEYDGTNIRQLARKYDYSEKTVRRILKNGIEE